MHRRLENIEGIITPEAAFDFLQRLDRCDDKIVYHYDLEEGPQMVVKFAFICKEMIKNNPEIRERMLDLESKAEKGDYRDIEEYCSRVVISHDIGKAIGISDKLMEIFPKIFNEEFKKWQELKLHMLPSVRKQIHTIRKEIVSMNICFPLTDAE